MPVFALESDPGPLKRRRRRDSEMPMQWEGVMKRCERGGEEAGATGGSPCTQSGQSRFKTGCGVIACMSAVCVHLDSHDH
jgi:hypothetical protein